MTHLRTFLRNEWYLASKRLYRWKMRFTVCRRQGHAKHLVADKRWRHSERCGRCGAFLGWIRCSGNGGWCDSIATRRRPDGSFRCEEHLA